MKKLGWVERRDKMEKIFPELLEACRFTYDIISKTPEYFKPEYQEVIRKIRQAIAKAEGQQ